MYGQKRTDRTGTGTRSIFAPRPMSFNLTGFGLPLLHEKKVSFHNILTELLWIIRGDRDISYLLEHNVHIWSNWADEDGQIGPMYGPQLRSWSGGIDQLQGVIDQIKADPFSRRHVLTTWNVGDLDKMALAPCHGTVIQFYVNGEKLDCFTHQRSADMFLGVPYNIVSYSLLTMMIAQVTGYKPGILVYSLGDAHIYENHVEQVNTLLHRRWGKRIQNLPTVTIDPSVKSIDDFRHEHFTLNNYKPMPAIKAPVAV